MSYYDKEGNQISSEEWGKKWTTPDYKIIKQEDVKKLWVSTVWLGMNHSYVEGTKLIFETMVFSSKNDMDDRYVERYETEQQAKEGHIRAVQWAKEQQKLWKLLKKLLGRK